MSIESLFEESAKCLFVRKIAMAKIMKLISWHRPKIMQPTGDTKHGSTLDQSCFSQKIGEICEGRCTVQYAGGRGWGKLSEGLGSCGGGQQVGDNAASLCPEGNFVFYLNYVILCSPYWDSDGFTLGTDEAGDASLLHNHHQDHHHKA